MANSSSPRTEIYDMIKNEDLHSLLDKAALLHGHYCPGLALGVKASYTALKKIDAKPEGMEEVIAIVETNNCSTDGVQLVTGCSFGNNSLIFKDLGKNAVTLTKRDAKGIRIVTKKDAGKQWYDEFPKYRELFEKVVIERNAIEDEKKRFSEFGEKVSHHIMDIESEKLFKVEKTGVEIPDYAPIHESLTCENCGESVMSTRTVKDDGETLCLLCGGEEFFELDGYGINCKCDKR